MKGGKVRERTLANAFPLNSVFASLSLSFRKPSTLSLALEAGVIVLFPVLFFFNFLFYTDTGSTLWVFASYLLMIRGSAVGRCVDCSTQSRVGLDLDAHSLSLLLSHHHSAVWLGWSP